jgi:hypothetical protein
LTKTSTFLANIDHPVSVAIEIHAGNYLIDFRVGAGSAVKSADPDRILYHHLISLLLSSPVGQ